MALRGDGKMAGIPAALHKKGERGLRRRPALVLCCGASGGFNHNTA